MVGAATALRDSHEIVGWALVFANAAAATWALAAHYQEPLRRRALWWFTGVAQLLVFAQAIIGVVILQQENLEPDDFHLLYGFSMIVAIGIVYSYRQQMEPYKYLLYAGGGYFLMGLGIRAFILRPG
ncbi:MAG: hypothetical protein ACE367_08940 [Acidimicrobiales bacterium]|jgi:hypothetical protein